MNDVVASHEIQAAAVPFFGIIPRGHIRLGKWNPRKRITEAELIEMRDSIRQHGIYQPILVRPIEGEEDLYELVFGERRFRGAELAELEMIPCQVRTMTDKEVRIAQHIENLQRKDVHPIEEAEGYAVLMKEDGYTADQLAEETGKSRSYIYGRLKFAALAPEVREAFYDGKLNASTALLIARIPVPDLQIRATEEVTTWNSGAPLSYRDAFEHIKERYMLDLERARFPIQDAKLVKAAGSCTDCPKRTGNQPMLYTDVSADICTDPNCYASKCRAHDDKTLAIAQKKGIPVYEGEEAEEFLDSTELVPADVELHYFERRVKSADYFTKVESVLPEDQMPTPSAYVRVDGKVKPMFEQTAMQAALEKAGVCETEEARAARQEAPHKASDPAKSEALSEKERKHQETIQRREKGAEAESKVRITAYRKIREAFKAGLPVGAWRTILKEMLVDHSAPQHLLPEVYAWGKNSDEETLAYIEDASSEELQLLLMDMIFSNTLSLGLWSMREDGSFDEEDEGYLSFVELSSGAGVDIAAIRAELQPVLPAEEKPAAAEPSKKKGGKKKADKASTNDEQVEKPGLDPAAAWPFPTGARP